MSIDDKLGPISRRLGSIGRAYWHIDEEVHRYYEKIVKRWEEDGHERHTLEYTSLGTMLAAIMFTNLGCEILGSVKKREFTIAEKMAGYTSAVYGGVQALITALNFEVDKKKTIDGTIRSHTAYDITEELIPGFRKMRNAVRGLRLLSLVTGAGAVVGGGIQLLEGYKTNDPLLMDHARMSMNIGWVLLGSASAAYIGDYEPALLDRAPAWKRALGTVKNAIAPKPTPAPVPIPVQNYSAAEVDV